MFSLNVLKFVRHGLSVSSNFKTVKTTVQCIHRQAFPRFAVAKPAVDIPKKVPKKKKQISEENAKQKDSRNVVALSTAEYYDLENLVLKIKKDQIFEITNLNKELKSQDFLHALVKNEKDINEPREMFIFREGSFVAWNVDDMDVEVMIGLLKEVGQNSYDDKIVRQESELMSYSKGDCTKILDDDIVLAIGEAEQHHKFTVSNAVALSVKLGSWEAVLANYISSMEKVTADLKQGTKIKMSQAEVLKRTGELFALRHAINLRSDLLDTPDLYWDREDLENIYLPVISHFSVNRRTKVINEKINHCLELVQLLSTRLSDNHHVRLEWMIIILIMVEVGFEVLHHVERNM